MSQFHRVSEEEPGKFQVIELSASISKNLPPGYYRPAWEHPGKMYLLSEGKPKNPIISMSGDPYDSIVEEFHTFWNARNKYNAMNLSYKRGFLFHGEPGTGKSGIMQLLAQVTVELLGGYCLYLEGNMASSAEVFIKAIRSLSPSAPLTVILDEFDVAIRNGCDDDILLLLDGIQFQPDGVVFLAATNEFEDLDPKFYRPSRLDTLIEFGRLSEAAISDYLKYIAPNVKFTKAQVAKLCNFTLAEIKEIVIQIKIFNKTFDVAVANREKIASLKTLDATL